VGWWHGIYLRALKPNLLSRCLQLPCTCSTIDTRTICTQPNTVHTTPVSISMALSTFSLYSHLDPNKQVLGIANAVAMQLEFRIRLLNRGFFRDFPLSGLVLWSVVYLPACSYAMHPYCDNRISILPSGSCESQYHPSPGPRALKDSPRILPGGRSHQHTPCKISHQANSYARSTTLYVLCTVMNLDDLGKCPDVVEQSAVHISTHLVYQRCTRLSL
jgi:hypothetical protein